MFKNYFILNRLITELNNELSGSKIIRAFSFEKDKINLILLKNKEELYLEISVNPGLPYLILKRRFSIPKKNLVDIFHINQPLTNIIFEIADNDRIIRIKSDEASIYFTIRGKVTNVYIIKDSINYVESFKKTDNKIIDDFNKEIINHNFISYFNNIIIRNEDIDNLRKKYPNIGKEIINEINLRKENQNKSFNKIFTEVLNEIRKNSPALFIDENTGDVNLGLESFSIFPFTRKESFHNLTETFNHFLREKYLRATDADKKKLIEKHLERELKKVSGKLNDVKALIQRGSKEEEYNRKGNLLLININDLSKGRDKIELEDVYDENISVSIKLDPKLSPKQNVDYYFNKARNEKKRLEKMNMLFSDLNDKYLKLKIIKDKFLKAESTEDLNSIMKELKINKEEKQKPDESIKNKFRHYIIHDKFNAYVGKDSKSNDLLTMKFAKQNDYWFHARSVSGSHLVLKNENPKEGIPKNILKLAASIAAYHSKAKTSGMAPVSFTQKKYVTKKKGMEPGKVVLLREEVLIVKPEITDGIRYESES